ncbi:MAG TPA: SprB repeat-containing protein, partial [Bacteroidia bacterium]|nr:SprB repeat-containing protein [Bacteroidia bacterium]
MKKIITTLLAVFVFGTFITYGQYNVLLNFNGTNGSEPSGGVTISGNNIYGTASIGGAGSGCIYTLHRDGSGYRDLFNFVDSTGSLPNNTVTLYNGKFYGTAWEGGSFRYYGVVYSVDTDGTNYKVLLNFNYTNGDNPPTDLVLSGTRIYGIASGGGFYGGGCIFTIDTNGNNYKDLYDFGAASGDAPYCKLLLVGTKFYGTTFDAGTYGGGTIFSIDTNGGNYFVMHNFGNTNDASNSYATLTLIGGKIFGTTYFGGSSNKGALFSIDTDGSGYKKILDFNGTNGANPDMGSLKFEGNRLWGMTSNGGAHNKGLVFSIDTDGSGFLDRFDFNNTVGATPDAQLTFYGSSIYGETTFGGSSNDGIVFGADTNCFMGSILVSSNITCHGYNNGSASISVSGGASPYTYLWSNSSTQSSVSNLSTGTYSVTLSDNSGNCSQTNSFTITQPAVLTSVTATITSNVSCHGGNDGNASVIITGGGAPYHYSWANSSSTVVSTFNPSGPFLSAG